MENNTIKYPEFRKLLYKAIGTRTQAQFSKETGIAAPHLNRLLRNPEIPQPSIRTLEKIAEHSNGSVSVYRLQKACGYDIGEDTPEDMDFAERNRRTAEAIRNGILNLSKKHRAFDNIDEFFDSVTLLYTDGNIGFEKNEIEDYTDGGRNGAEKVCNVTFTWEAEEGSCQMACAVFFCETIGGKVIILDAATDLAELIKLMHPIARRVFFLLSAEKNVVTSQITEVYTTRLNDVKDWTLQNKLIIHEILNQDKTLKEFVEELKKEDEK